MIPSTYGFIISYCAGASWTTVYDTTVPRPLSLTRSIFPTLFLPHRGHTPRGGKSRGPPRPPFGAVQVSPPRDLPPEPRDRHVSSSARRGGRRRSRPSRQACASTRSPHSTPVASPPPPAAGAPSRRPARLPSRPRAGRAL